MNNYKKGQIINKKDIDIKSKDIWPKMHKDN